MTDFLCVRMLKTNQGISYFEAYGEIEIRNPKLESEHERNALQSSMESFDLHLDPNAFLRIATIVQADTVGDALDRASILFEESINVFELQNFTSFVHEVLEAGYYSDLESNSVQPILKQNRDIPFIPTIFHVANEAFPPILPSQYILAGREDNAVKAYIRAAHWLRRAKAEQVPYLRFLFKWIAVESLSKLDKDDAIFPKACLVIGFPLGHYSRLTDPQVLLNLNGIKNYGIWKDYFRSNLEKASVARNNIVHSGFRGIEIPEIQLRTFLRILTYVTSRMAGYVQNAILTGFKELSEIWEVMPILVSDNTNLVNDVQGNIIFTFENGHFFDE